MFVLVFNAGLNGCAFAPEWMRLARESGYEQQWVGSGSFRHLILLNGRPGGHLRMYVEGDGMPWIGGNRVAVDPTPANPVLLRLMAIDHNAAIYLGRPCYFGQATQPECHPRWWTVDRYSRPILRSMCTVANKVSSLLEASTVELVGFSGGAALVTGMRDCTDRLVAITTIAGNLDVGAWTAYHGYSELNVTRPDSPASDPPYRVVESHWQCENDENIPPRITNGYFETNGSARRFTVRGCTHATGWGRHFESIMSQRR